MEETYVSDPHHLRLIGHGTNGSDGIEEGIHLRWAFNDKLGFPVCTKLFRRESFLQNHYVWEIESEKKPDDPILYEVYSIQGIYDVKFQFFPLGGIGRKILTKVIHGNTERKVAFIPKGGIEVQFSRPVDRIELGLLIRQESRFDITVLYGEAHTYPQSVLGTYEGWKDIYFDVEGATGMIISGEEILLSALNVWICSPVEARPWEEIKLDCGCGLPITLRDKATPLTVSEITPKIDHDIIECRLSTTKGTKKNKSVSSVSSSNIQKLASLLKEIFAEGISRPHGWTTFEATRKEKRRNPSGQTTQVAIYDMLLAQCLHVPIAKVFDMYYVDHPPESHIYYDYRIETIWPEWNMRKLDKQISFDQLELGQKISSRFILEGLYFHHPKDAEVVSQPNEEARTTLGLRLGSQTAFRFVHPVTEVQLWVMRTNSSKKVEVQAFRDYYLTYQERVVISKQAQLIRLHINAPINEIRIIGGALILSRIHYDFEEPPYFTQSTEICGVKQGISPYPLEKPDDLRCEYVPGGTMNYQDGKKKIIPFQVGLSWKANENPDIKLLPQHPVAYHIQRKATSGSANRLTQESPVLISAKRSVQGESAVPKKWMEKRQYYLDSPSAAGPYQYQVGAIDLFGRESEFSGFKSYTETVAPPLAPVNVSAVFLDYATYIPPTNSTGLATSTNQQLSQEDINWLGSNQISALKVQWEWPVEAQLHTKEVDAFQVFLVEGWLNTYQGTITSIGEGFLPYSELALTPQEVLAYPLLPTYQQIPVWILTVRVEGSVGLEENVLRLSWLKQKNKSFLVLTQTAGEEVRLTILKSEQDLSMMPAVNKGVSISVLPDKAGFINYGVAANWHATDILHHTEVRPIPTATTPKVDEGYTLYIPQPAFPQLALSLNDPSRYGQVGVCASINGMEGATSTPASIMAIYQQAPPAPSMPTYQEVALEKASPADVHAKSTYYVRWEKTGLEVVHYLYRAMDTSLFLEDNTRRAGGDTVDYVSLQNQGFPPADVTRISQITYEPNVNDALAQYVDLTPTQMYIIANIPENQAVYTRLHGEPIQENDPAYQDRITEIPDPGESPTYTPASDILMYADTTLNGRGNNVYFYKLKTTGLNGLESSFSPSSLPVICPKTTPPQRPVISSIMGGENQIIIRWAVQPNARVAGYLLYRTDVKANAADWRLTEVIKHNPSDEFSVICPADVPAYYEFIDTTAAARKPYYYTLVAVGVDDEGRWLRSKEAVPSSGQAVNQTPPVPPDITSLTWVRVDEQGSVYGFDSPQPNTQVAVLVEWSHQNANLQCLVQHQADYMDGFQTVSEWLPTGVYSFIHKNSYSGTDHTYRIQVRDEFGNKNTVQLSATLASQD